MWRRIKNWWNNNALLFFAQGLIGVLRAVFRVKEAVAPPERQAKLRELRERMEAMEREKNAVLRQMDDLPNADFARREQILDDFAVFTRKHNNGANDATWEKLRATRRALHADSEALASIKAEHSGNPSDAVTAFRAYTEAHPDSALAHSYLIGALRKVDDYDAAIIACREHLATMEADTSSPAPSGRAFMQRLTIGTLLTEKSDPRAAIFELERLIAQTRGKEELLHSVAYFALGEAYLKAGNVAEAKRAWREAAKHDTTDTLKAEIAKRLREMS